MDKDGSKRAAGGTVLGSDGNATDRNQSQGLGDRVKGELAADEVYGDIDFTDVADATVDIAGNQSKAIAGRGNIEPDDPRDPEPETEVKEEVDEVETVVEDDDDKQETETVEEESDETTDDNDQESDEGEVIEVDEDEAEHLLGMDKEQLVAWGVKHRKGNSTLQSRIAKVENILGKDFTTQIESGQVPNEVGILFQSLNDETFQRYVGDFFNTHEAKDGKYVLTHDPRATGDQLVQYSELVGKAAQVESKIDRAARGEIDDDNFSLSAAMKERDDIRKQMSDIESSTRQPTTPVSPEEKAKIGQKVWDDLITDYPELKDEQERLNFTNYVKSNSQNYLNVLYGAYKSNGRVKKKVKRFVLKEMESVRTNKQQAKKANIKTTAKTKEPVKAKEPDEMLDYFGDIE